MIDFTSEIQREALKINSLHEKISSTYKNRTKNRAAWERACKESHSYISPLSRYYEDVNGDPSLYSEVTIEFIIQFLELDPIYFRSGYLKEEMLDKIRKIELNENQQERLRKVLISAVEFRGNREFRRYCKLLPRVMNKDIVDKITQLTNHSDGRVHSRAKLMLSFVKDLPHNKQLR